MSYENSSSQAPAPLHAIDSKGQGSVAPIPEALRSKWAQLAHRGVPAASYAKFQEYLEGDGPMTAEVMEAGCKVASCFPSISRQQGYGPLGQYIMNLLHRRFQGADAKEKERIQWVASSLFCAMHHELYELKLKDYVGNFADSYLVALQTIMERAVGSALTYPPSDSHSSLALMHHATQREMIDWARGSVVRKEGDRYIADKRKVLFADSLHGLTNATGVSLADVMPANTRGPLDTLLQLEAMDRTSLSELIKLKKLSPNQRQLLTYCQDMLDQDQPIVWEKAAEHLGVTPSRVSQLLQGIRKNATFVPELLNDLSKPPRGFSGR